MRTMAATYIVGDVHGCADTLGRLMAKIGYDRTVDRLIFTGDLVNGGPNSLEVVRWVKDEGAESVLGNHDLHLLGVRSGARGVRKNDTFTDLLEAPDAEELLEWLRRRPFMVRSEGFVVTHAGLHPEWDFDVAERKARVASEAIRGDDLRGAIRQIFAGGAASGRIGPNDNKLDLAFVVDVFTRMRLLDSKGCLDLDFKGPPEKAPPGSRPWYAIPRNGRWPGRVFFGHWAAAGLKLTESVAGLDSGCVWGGPLTACRVEDGRIFQVDSEMDGKDEGEPPPRGNTQHYEAGRKA